MAGLMLHKRKQTVSRLTSSTCGIRGITSKVFSLSFIDVRRGTSSLRREENSASSNSGIWRWSVFHCERKGSRLRRSVRTTSLSWFAMMEIVKGVGDARLRRRDITFPITSRIEASTLVHGVDMTLIMLQIWGRAKEMSFQRPHTCESVDGVRGEIETGAEEGSYMVGEVL